MFTTEERDRVQQHVIEWARADPRVVAGAVVGSMAHHPGDRFSDLDLTFGVDEGYPFSEVLEDWSRRLVDGFDPVPLFDLPSGGAFYRVFLLPGCLQVDLSFAPASQFGAFGPQFRLLFGSAVDKPFPPAPNPHELFGYGAHHAVRARVCIERTRSWQAEYWIGAVREKALAMACLRFNLPAHFARGFDALPDSIQNDARGALIQSLDRSALLQALKCGADLLLSEGAAASVCAPHLAARLREFIAMP
jgi:hypothetical protein